MMKAWLELARISNLPTAWTNATAAWLLMGGSFSSIWGWSLLASSAMYVGGMILNDAVDHRFDQHYRPERPIPSGRISLATAWIVGLILLLVGAYVLILACGASSTWVMALAAAILIYDFYHKPWAGSVWVMGACRTLLYLAVASSLTEEFSGELVARAVALGLYIVGLTLIARSESGDGEGRTWVAKLGLMGLFSPAVVAISYGFMNYQANGNLGLFGATLAVAAVFFTWVMKAIRLMKKRPKSNIGKSVGLLLAGVVMIDALAVVSVNPFLGLAFLLLAPLLLLWQRKIAAT